MKAWVNRQRGMMVLSIKRGSLPVFHLAKRLFNNHRYRHDRKEFSLPCLLLQWFPISVVFLLTQDSFLDGFCFFPAPLMRIGIKHSRKKPRKEEETKKWVQLTWFLFVTQEILVPFRFYLHLLVHVMMIHAEEREALSFWDINWKILPIMSRWEWINNEISTASSWQTATNMRVFNL
jgi:hypothetical protein